MRKVTIYTFAAITVLAAAGCKKFDSKSEIIPVTGISLDYDDITLVKGDYAELHATITPSNATGKNVFWSTSGPNIATVENGVVRAGSYYTGSATITATSSNPDVKATCKVTVVSEIIPITGMTLSTDKVIMAPGAEGYRVYPSFTPNNTTQRQVIWSIEDTSVATVDASGSIKGIAVGETKIWAKSRDNEEVKASATILVVKPFESITITYPENPAVATKLGCEETKKIRYTVTPSDSRDAVKFELVQGSSSKLEVSPTGEVTAKGYSYEPCKVRVSSVADPSVYADVSFQPYDAPSGIKVWHKGSAIRRTMYIGAGCTQTLCLQIENSNYVKPGTEIGLWGPETTNLTATLNEARTELTVKASSLASTSTSSNKVSGSIKLTVGYWYFNVNFYISEFDAYQPKIGDIIYYDNQKILTADSGYRGGGIYEDPVNGPGDTRLGIIAYIGSDHLSEDPFAASYNLPGIGDGQIHGIAIPYNTSYVCRKTKPGGDFTDSCWSSIPSSNNGGEIFSKEHKNITTHYPNITGYDVSRLSYSSSNSAKRLAFHNTVGLLYHNLARGDSYRVHQVLYVSSPEALEIFGGSNSESRYVNSNAYYFGRTSNSNLNYAGNLSTAPAYKKITPWLFPTLADLKTVFAGKPNAADNNSTVAATVKEHETVFSKAVALFSINKNANYLDYTYWTSQEYSERDAMALYIKHDGTLSATNQDKNETHKFLPVFYF